ncbi:hypothetical protein H9P43_000972 [Blastocladiella emersonii ATCC 22665]|nr:hypothetical protein H9P43_000972 [Blastocladiella emersonii ATCC 22665]
MGTTAAVLFPGAPLLGSKSRSRQPTTTSIASAVLTSSILAGDGDTASIASSDSLSHDPLSHSGNGSVAAAPVHHSRIATVAPTLADRAHAARTELHSLQAAAQAALTELEHTESARRDAEATRQRAEREVETVNKKIEATQRKRGELEALLEALRAENDELEEQLNETAQFLIKHQPDDGGSGSPAAVPGLFSGASGGGGTGARSRQASQLAS